MMPRNHLMDDRIVELAAACLAQLEREETNLRATVECLEQIRRCAIQNDIEALTRLTLSHEQLEANSRAISEARQALRCRITHVLDIPEHQATIRRIADLAPAPFGKQLTEARHRLIRLVSQANTLGHSIALIVRQSMELMREVLECLTGSQANEGYSQSGAQADSPNASLIQFRC